MIFLLSIDSAPPPDIFIENRYAPSAGTRIVPVSRTAKASSRRAASQFNAEALPLDTGFAAATSPALVNLPS